MFGRGFYRFERGFLVGGFVISSGEVRCVVVFWVFGSVDLGIEVSLFRVSDYAGGNVFCFLVFRRFIEK